MIALENAPAKKGGASQTIQKLTRWARGTNPSTYQVIALENAPAKKGGASQTIKKLTRWARGTNPSTYQVIALENAPAKKGGIASTLKSAVGSYDGWTITVEVQGYLTYKKNNPLGPYRRPVHRVLGGS